MRQNLTGNGFTKSPPPRTAISLFGIDLAFVRRFIDPLIGGVTGSWNLKAGRGNPETD